jgi:hypothetical protein
MDKVTKHNGVFKLEADPPRESAQQARALHTADIEKLKSKLGEDDLTTILEHILIRLKALE